MTHEEKWIQISEIDRKLKAVDERQKELWREKSRLLMTQTPPAVARDNIPHDHPRRKQRLFA